MFNPQLDELNWRVVEKYENDTWIKTNLIDLKVGNRFRMFESTGEPVEDEDGRTEFVAATNGYLDPVLRIPTIDITV